MDTTNNHLRVYQELSSMQHSLTDKELHKGSAKSSKTSTQIQSTTKTQINSNLKTTVMKKKTKAVVVAENWKREK